MPGHSPAVSTTQTPHGQSCVSSSHVTCLSPQTGHTFHVPARTCARVASHVCPQWPVTLNTTLLLFTLTVSPPFQLPPIYTLFPLGGMFTTLTVLTMFTNSLHQEREKAIKPHGTRFLSHALNRAPPGSVVCFKYCSFFCFLFSFIYFPYFASGCQKVHWYPCQKVHYPQ